jgi:hypothetical protein
MIRANNQINFSRFTLGLITILLVILKNSSVDADSRVPPAVPPALHIEVENIGSLESFLLHTEIPAFKSKKGRPFAVVMGAIQGQRPLQGVVTISEGRIADTVRELRKSAWEVHSQKTQCIWIRTPRRLACAWGTTDYLWQGDSRWVVAYTAAWLRHDDAAKDRQIARQLYDTLSSSLGMLPGPIGYHERRAHEAQDKGNRKQERQEFERIVNYCQAKNRCPQSELKWEARADPTAEVYHCGAWIASRLLLSELAFPGKDFVSSTVSSTVAMVESVDAWHVDSPAKKCSSKLNIKDGYEAWLEDAHKRAPLAARKGVCSAVGDVKRASDGYAKAAQAVEDQLQCAVYSDIATHFQIGHAIRMLDPTDPAGVVLEACGISHSSNAVNSTHEELVQALASFSSQDELHRATFAWLADAVKADRNISSWCRDTLLAWKNRLSLAEVADRISPTYLPTARVFCPNFGLCVVLINADGQSEAIKIKNEDSVLASYWNYQDDIVRYMDITPTIQPPILEYNNINAHLVFDITERAPSDPSIVANGIGQVHADHGPIVADGTTRSLASSQAPNADHGPIAAGGITLPHSYLGQLWLTISQVREIDPISWLSHAITASFATSLPITRLQDRSIVSSREQEIAHHKMANVLLNGEQESKVGKSSLGKVLSMLTSSATLAKGQQTLAPRVLSRMSPVPLTIVTTSTHMPQYEKEIECDVITLVATDTMSDARVVVHYKIRDKDQVDLWRASGEFPLNMYSIDESHSSEIGFEMPIKKLQQLGGMRLDLCKVKHE